MNYFSQNSLPETPCILECIVSISALTNVRAGKKVEVLLETKDRGGTPLDRGGERVTAELFHRDGGVPRVQPVHVSDLRNGKYALNFIPEIVGKLLLHVYVKGQQIKVSCELFI